MESYDKLEQFLRRGGPNCNELAKQAINQKMGKKWYQKLGKVRINESLILKFTKDNIRKYLCFLIQVPEIQEAKDRALPLQRSVPFDLFGFFLFQS